MPPSVRRIADDVGLCIVFFTRIPLPGLRLSGRPLSECVWAAPLVGVVVALVGAGVYALAALAGLSAGSAAALALAACMLVTGCLHEDGLSDTVDGFGGGTTRERTLEIMRDSRIGAFGACALGLSILIRWSALADIGSPGLVLAALIAAHGASRATIPALMALLPAARPGGLSASAGAVQPSVALLAAALGVVCLLVLGIWPAICALILLGVAPLLFRALCLRRIGGQTGDTLGAMQQIAEAIVLLVASAFIVDL